MTIVGGSDLLLVGQVRAWPSAVLRKTRNSPRQGEETQKMVDRTSGAYRERMKRIAQKAVVLNDACDQMTDEIEAVERDLAEAKVGLQVEVLGRDVFSTVEDNPNNPGTPLKHVWRLGYDKIEGAWRIVVYKYAYAETDDDETVVRPLGPQVLAKASRILRMEAHAYLDDLLKAIEASLQVKAKNY